MCKSCPRKIRRTPCRTSLFSIQSAYASCILAGTDSLSCRIRRRRCPEQLRDGKRVNEVPPQDAQASCIMQPEWASFGTRRPERKVAGETARETQIRRSGGGAVRSNSGMESTLQKPHPFFHTVRICIVHPRRNRFPLLSDPAAALSGATPGWKARERATPGSGKRVNEVPPQDAQASCIMQPEWASFGTRRPERKVAGETTRETQIRRTPCRTSLFPYSPHMHRASSPEPIPSLVGSGGGAVRSNSGMESA